MAPQWLEVFRAEHWAESQKDDISQVKTEVHSSHRCRTESEKQFQNASQNKKEEI